jgi:hypothetical protein
MEEGEAASRLPYRSRVIRQPSRRQAERFPAEGLLALGQELRRGIHWRSSCLVQFLFSFVFLHLFCGHAVVRRCALLRLANHARLYASGMPEQSQRRKGENVLDQASRLRLLPGYWTDRRLILNSEREFERS